MILYIFGAIIVLTISSIGIFIGLDLRKPSHWLFVVCGFLFGLFAGLAVDDWGSGVGYGIVSAALVAYTGILLQKQKEYLRGAVKKLGLNETSFDILGSNKKPKKKSNPSNKSQVEKSNTSTKKTAGKARTSNKRNVK